MTEKKRIVIIDIPPEEIMKFWLDIKSKKKVKKK